VYLVSSTKCIIHYLVYLHNIPLKENTTFLGENFRMRLWKHSIPEVWYSGLILSMSLRRRGDNKIAVNFSHAAVPKDLKFLIQQLITVFYHLD